MFGRGGAGVEEEKMAGDGEEGAEGEEDGGDAEVGAADERSRSPADGLLVLSWRCARVSSGEPAGDEDGERGKAGRT